MELGGQGVLSGSVDREGGHFHCHRAHLGQVAVGACLLHREEAHFGRHLSVSLILFPATMEVETCHLCRGNL